MFLQIPLFDAEDPATVSSPARPAALPVRRRTVAPPSWVLVDHACRFCFGRVLARKERGKVVQVRCAECGKSEHADTASICCCGTECGALGRALQCFRNPAPSAENPQEIMVREVEQKS